MFEYMSPGNIRFTQDSINWRFRGGGSVNDAIESIINGRMKASDFPMITVVEKNGKYYSLDNRRLYVFRALNQKGLLDKVKVKIGSKIWHEKDSSENDGVSVDVRGGGYTYPHAIPATDTGYSSSTMSNCRLDNSPSNSKLQYSSCVIDISEQQTLLGHRSPPPKKFHISEDSTSTSENCFCRMLKTIFAICTFAAVVVVAAIR